MKTTAGSVLKKCIVVSYFLTFVGSLAFAAVPPLNVTVSDAGGKVVFRGKTNSTGAFMTGKFAPGNYVVQFNGSAQGTYGLSVSAGKTATVSESIPGEKLARGGVAMRLKVAEGMSIRGQVTSGTAGAVSASNVGNAKVKVVNGKRWFWVTSSTGSNIGGHWVEEGTVEARNLGNYSKQAINNLQEKAKGAPNE